MLIDNLTRAMLMLSHAACGVLGENRNPGKTERPRPSHQNHLVFKDVTWHLGIARKPTMWGWILYRKTFWSDPKSYNERSLSNNMRHFLFASAFTQESDAYLEWHIRENRRQIHIGFFFSIAPSKPTNLPDFRIKVTKIWKFSISEERQGQEKRGKSS